MALDELLQDLILALPGAIFNRTTDDGRLTLLCYIFEVYPPGFGLLVGGVVF